MLYLCIRRRFLSSIVCVLLIGCESDGSESVASNESLTLTTSTEFTPEQPAIGAASSDELLIIDTNVSGGGFQSDVTISPDGGVVYSAADVSGIFKSTDAGLRFESINEGLRSPKVASLAMTSDNPQILYAGTGDKGGSGGLFRSVDGGETWAMTADGVVAQFAGNHSASTDPVPIGHPRSNGNLVAIDEGSNAGSHTDDIVLTGTYKDGVHIFTQGGDVAVSAVNISSFVRSVALSPALQNTLYAAIQFSDSTKNGIYKVDYSNLTNPTSTLQYQTPRPEGLVALGNGHVYGAIGEAGIVRFDGDAWTLQNSGLSTNNANRQWTAVAGYNSGGEDIVYAGTNNMGGNASGAAYSNVWRTTNGGTDWEPLINTDTNVSDQITGQEYEWWFRTTAFRQAGLGRTNSVVSSIEVAHGANPQSVTDDIIYVSGRGGLWKSESGGQSWQPAVFNMQATSNSGVAINPNNQDQVVLANTDYVVLETNSRFDDDDLSRDKPDGAPSKAFDVIFDTVSDELVLGVGSRDTNINGEVFTKSATVLGNPSGAGWTSTQLSQSPLTNGGRVRAVSYGYHNAVSATTQTILAAVEGEGVFRFHNGTWTKSSGISIDFTDRSNFVWPDNANSGVVYLLDLSSGLHRSNDGGVSWNNIWPSMSFNNNDFFNTGYIAASADDPSTIYLSVQGNSESPIGTRFRVYRLTGADTATFGLPDTSGITDITKHSDDSPILRPGPIVVGLDGKLWLTQQQDSNNSTRAALFYMESPKRDLVFTEVTPAKYPNMAISPSGIDVSSDGYVYISQVGLGIVKLYRP